MNAEERKALHALIDQERRKIIKRPTLTDEIYRQYTVNGISTEQIANLLKMPHYRVRARLRVRGVKFGPRQYRISKRSVTGNYLISVPAGVVRQLDENTRFTCEMTDDGILYRRVSEKTRRTGA